MKDFRDLKVWIKAHELAVECYNVTANFPQHEMFGIVAQIRRAGSSIGENIAEAAVEVETANSKDSCRWPWARPAS